MVIHDGLDLVNIEGTPVIASADGTIFEAEKDKVKGLYIKINHRYGFSTEYHHLSRILVNVEQLVKKDQTIGLLGKTGRSIGPHLHYEIRINNEPIDPQPYILLDKSSNLISNKDK